METWLGEQGDDAELWGKKWVTPFCKITKKKVKCSITNE